MEGAAEMNQAIEGSTEAPHIKRTDNAQPPDEPHSQNALEPPAPLVSQDTDWSEQFFMQSSATLLESMNGQGLNCNVSSQSRNESSCASPRSSSDPGVMVEELTLKNYKSPNLTLGGSSSSGEKPSIRGGFWQNFTRILGGPRDTAPRESNLTGHRDGTCNAFLPPFGVQRPVPSTQLEPNNSKVSGHASEGDNHIISSNVQVVSHGAIRTKVISASGFQQVFVKKGKGLANQQHGATDTLAMVNNHRRNQRPDLNVDIASNSSERPKAKEVGVSLLGGGGGSVGVSASYNQEISLRKWLKPKCQKISKVERIHIFKQILDLVDSCHSQEIALQSLRPSYFIMLPPNQVKYIGSFVPQGSMVPLSGSTKQDINYSEHKFKRKRYMEPDNEIQVISLPKHQKFGVFGSTGFQHFTYPHRSGSRREIAHEEKEIDSARARNSGCDFRELKLNDHCKSINMSCSLTEELEKLEERWYASPEESNGSVCQFPSNIYSLGVLLFELFCYFETWEAHSSAMSDLRHRILPPSFLSESPKEAGFCLWLLHPDPSLRPKTKDILHSDLISESKDLSGLDHSSALIEEEDTEADLLLHFLLSAKDKKEAQAAKLTADLGCLQADIQEVERRHSFRTEFSSASKGLVTNLSGFSFAHSPTKSTAQLEVGSRLPGSSVYEERLMRNIEQLESAYFSMRSTIDISEANAGNRSDDDVLKLRDRLYQVQSDADENETTDRLGTFFEGLCKYARYSKFEVRGSMKNVDILNSANVICSLSFDRDEDYFAAAGVSKKIKVFEFGALLNDSVDIHYPLIEMSSRSKLSCVCWNNYIRNYLASTDYEGIVQLWDASTGQGFTQLLGHQKRAWSVSFSQVDPTKLASGSDDCSVKLWSINEKGSIGAIRNVANVCCVQFSPYASNLLAFGSADYKIYCYDLRNTRIPWCTLAGHEKAVSYVKFLDSETLISASTDNSLKIWDLKKTSTSGLSTNACSLTLSGHTNEKNFVGLSVCDGYITCGSETNEVYAYYKTFPMPITSRKFGSIDPITGQETSDDNGQFVSSVCWRGKSNMVVAANSTGSIKVLQLV